MYGHTRDSAGLAQHISFANHDLQLNGLSAIQYDQVGLWVDSPYDRVADVMAIVRMHGFELDEGVAVQPAIDSRKERPGAPSQGYASGGTLLDLVENFYGLGINELSRRAQVLLGYGGSRTRDYDGLDRFLRADEFLDLHAETWLNAFHPPPALSDGELRPFFSRGRPATMTDYGRGQGSSVSHVSTASDLLGTAVPNADTKEVKALLLYAHSVIINDPFQPKDVQHLSTRRFQDSNWSPQMAFGGEGTPQKARLPLAQRPDDFADALELMANLAPLIRSGVVFVLPAAPHDSLYFGDPDVAIKTLSRDLYLLGMVKSPYDRDTKMIASVALRRAMDQMRALLMYGTQTSSFIANKYDEMALDCLVSEMIRMGAIDRIHVRRSPDDVRLTTLSQLELPGVAGLRPRDMVGVRESDAFGSFRTDVRAVLAQLPNDSVASIEFREAMAQIASRLNLTTRRSAIADSLTGGLVGWGIGALTGWSVDGWRTAVGGVIGTAAYPAIKSFIPRNSALRNHYVAVS